MRNSKVIHTTSPSKSSSRMREMAYARRLKNRMSQQTGATEMVEKMGMNLTTFFTIYAKKALRERKKPFEISAPAALDPSVVEQKLDEADRLAAETDLRYTSDEVFSRVKGRN